MYTICYHIIYWDIPDVRYQTSNHHVITIDTPCVHQPLCPRSTVSSISPTILFPIFSIIFYPSQGSSQILGPLSLKSETKLKGWSLNAEEVRCQLPPTLRDQIRFLTGTCLLPILPYLLLPGIQWYQQPITAQIPSTCAVGSGSSLDTFVFNSQEPWFNSTELY